MVAALFVLLVNVPCRVINQFTVIKKNSFYLCFLSKDNITYKILPADKNNVDKVQDKVNRRCQNWVHLYYLLRLRITLTWYYTTDYRYMRAWNARYLLKLGSVPTSRVLIISQSERQLPKIYLAYLPVTW